VAVGKGHGKKAEPTDEQYLDQHASIIEDSLENQVFALAEF
jgi:hypothetical protein